jgi:hypothetical protein
MELVKILLKKNGDFFPSFKKAKKKLFLGGKRFQPVSLIFLFSCECCAIFVLYREVLDLVYTALC